MKKMPRLRTGLAACCLLTAGVAQAALTTSPYAFTTQPTTATGHLEWDEFSGANAFTPKSPDVAALGGAGSLTIQAFAQSGPPGGPPVPVLTSTQNIYTSSFIADFQAALSGLSTAEAFTTVVVQVASAEPLDPATFLLDGVAPTQFVDRGVIRGVLHNTDNGGGAPFDTSYYWAEWQVAAEADYVLRFSNLVPHTSLAQVRVDAFNVATAFDAVAAQPVPEPVAWASVLAALAPAVRRRRR